MSMNKFSLTRLYLVFYKHPYYVGVLICCYKYIYNILICKLFLIFFLSVPICHFFKCCLFMRVFKSTLL